MTTKDILKTKLNEHQFNAATDDAPEILTLACAGSGKSRTLAYRIAWLIAEREAQPEGIVAFTFTEKAADSIKFQVSNALQACGLDTNYLGRMYVGTIHSYCQYLLKLIDARYRQFEVLDDNRLKLYLIEKYGLLGLNQFLQRVNDRYFQVINKCHDAWVHHNEEMLKPEDVLEHDEELGTFLVSLRESLNRDQFLDFSAMQRLAVNALEQHDPAALESISRLSHLLVDEYQDINPIQDALISMLHENKESLFVVGDDDQSIYGWRGADVTRIQTFSERYENASEHTLDINYRSTPLIVEKADYFARQELGAQRIVKNPQARLTKEPHEFRNLFFDHRDDEADWVVNKIKELLGKRFIEGDGTVRGLTPADFAILMRSTRTPETGNNPPRHNAYTVRLNNAGIPFSLEAGGGLFDRPHVQALRDAFELFRKDTPNRNNVKDYYQQVKEIFPNAKLKSLFPVFTTWGRNIHAPTHGGVPRRRIYPQNLVFELLKALGVAKSNFDDGIMRDIGVFSSIIQDVETVYPSVDSQPRFASILNFLNVIAESGYDTSSSEIVQRPDAVTVSTVHKMKGLEFPVVFVVDVESLRFPGKRRSYNGFLPKPLLKDSIERGAYCGTLEEEARLFYTAITRAERFLYVTGSKLAEGWKRVRKPSPFAAHLTADGIISDAEAPTHGLANKPQRRRIEASNLPTSYSDIKYYLKCPKDYHFRKIFGFAPAVPDLFGFGMTVHASIGKLHQEFVNEPPTKEEAEAIANKMFHLKHVMPSSDPDERKGPYERAKAKARELVGGYAKEFEDDFRQKRQLEARFEILVKDAVVSGAIDLMIKEDENGNIVDACVIDFKTIERGENPEENADLEWTELSLQVQLYAKAAHDILGQFIEDGFVHLLRDGQRIQVPVGDNAVDAAISTVEWAVKNIVGEDFPMRPHIDKCPDCDFRMICPMQPENFATDKNPPEIHVPGDTGPQDVLAIRQFDSDFEGLD